MSVDLSNNVTNRLYKQGEDSSDLWIVDSYYTVPSCDLVNLNTGERLNFGLGGLTDRSFREAHLLPKEVAQLIHNNILRTPAK